MTKTRRLAAILIADVVGYSRLMEADEAGTLQALKERQRSIIHPVVSSHSGRIVKFMGDGVLIEFPSAVNAVNAALELQCKFAEANGSMTGDRQIVLRVGINLGDVVDEGTDIFGDTLNVAARLEELADAGGICISGQVHDAVQGKLAFAADDLGEMALKNIVRPVRVFHISSGPTDGSNQSASSGRHDKPSIAILPFTNMSGDPEQEYFADGLTEDIITELARFSSMTVIARHSSFQFRTRSENIRRVGQTLGARYLVDGSVRKPGQSIRISAQLIDVATGRHIWAERYDRKQEELFHVQDEIVRTIVATTEHRIIDTEADQASRRPPNSWAAYDCYLQARRYLNHYGTYGKAEQPLKRAVELDPTMAEAYAKLAHVCMAKFWNTLEYRFVQEADAYARKAISINNGSSEGHVAMSLVLAFQGRMDEAAVHAERAVMLNPNDVLSSVQRAQWRIYSGKFEQGLADVEQVLRWDPIPPTWYWDTRGAALYQLRRYQEALDSYSMVDEHQTFETAYIAASLAHLGRIEEAHRHVELLLAAAPDITIAKVLRLEPYQTEDAQRHFAEGLQMAGLN